MSDMINSAGLSQNSNNITPNPVGNTEPKKRFIFEVIDWLEAVIFALVVVVIIFSFLFRIVIVSGESMTNTLQDGDRVILNSTFYTPKAGDIVVVTKEGANNNKPLIKRIIATEGQKVKIDFDEGIVYVDGKALDEPYTRTPTNVAEDWDIDNKTYIKDADGYVTVPQGCLFVLGDNRNNSTDSRRSSVGFVSVNDVRHAFFRIFPFGGFGPLENPYNE